MSGSALQDYGARFLGNVCFRSFLNCIRFGKRLASLRDPFEVQCFAADFLIFAQGHDTLGDEIFLHHLGRPTDFSH